MRYVRLVFSRAFTQDELEEDLRHLRMGLDAGEDVIDAGFGLVPDSDSGRIVESGGACAVPTLMVPDGCERVLIVSVDCHVADIYVDALDTASAGRPPRVVSVDAPLWRAVRSTRHGFQYFLDQVENDAAVATVDLDDAGVLYVDAVRVLQNGYTRIEGGVIGPGYAGKAAFSLCWDGDRWRPLPASDHLAPGHLAAYTFSAWCGTTFGTGDDAIFRYNRVVERLAAALAQAALDKAAHELGFIDYADLAQERGWGEDDGLNIIVMEEREESEPHPGGRSRFMSPRMTTAFRIGKRAYQIIGRRQSEPACYPTPDTCK